MAMQRVHDCTLEKLKQIREAINKEKAAQGKKNLTVPDIIDSLADECLTKQKGK